MSTEAPIDGEFVRHVARNWSYVVEARLREGPLREPFKMLVQEMERQVIQAAMTLDEGPGQLQKVCARLAMHRNSLRVKRRELKMYVKGRWGKGKREVAAHG